MVGLMRKFAAVATLSLAGSFAGLAGASPASACSTSDHCYNIVSWDPSSVNGEMNATLYSNCLWATNSTWPYDNFATTEMWVFTNNSPSGAYWIEEGMAWGYPQGPNFYWYWADNRPNGGGYNEHDLTSLATNYNTSYNVSIHYHGSGIWYVYRDGNLIGTSTGNPGPSQGGETGTEFTTTSVGVSGESSNLSYKISGSTTLSHFWPGAVTYRQGASNPGSVSWIYDHLDTVYYANNC